jgi:hypothetical protein
VRIQGFGFECQGEAVELGGGGMAVAKAAHLVVSQPVTVTFEISAATPLKIDAVVWWKRDKLIGIRFDPADGNRHQVESYVSAKLAEAKQQAT